MWYGTLLGTLSFYSEGSGSVGVTRLYKVNEDSIRQNGLETGKMLYFLTLVIFEVQEGKSKTEGTVCGLFPEPLLVVKGQTYWGHCFLFSLFVFIFSLHFVIATFVFCFQTPFDH